MWLSVEMWKEKGAHGLGPGKGQARRGEAEGVGKGGRQPTCWWGTGEQWSLW